MKASKPNLYPAFILLLLAGFLAFSAWSAWRAVDFGPQVSDADYYSKGLKYSSTQLEKRAAASLGWSVAVEERDGALLFRLSDKAGAPVSGAAGLLTLYLPQNGSINLPLREVQSGRYRIETTRQMRGELSAHLEFERDGARLSRRLLLNLRGS